MGHRYLFSFILFLLFSGAFAQQNVLFHDDFVDNSNRWTIYNLSTIKTSIDSGHYVIHKPVGSYGQWLFHALYFDEDEDFEIQTRIKQVSGATNSGFGFCWGTGSWKDSYNFLITSTGYFKTLTYRDSEVVDSCQWKKISALKPHGQYNILGVKQQQKILYFSINGQLVHTKPATPFRGNYVGFVMFEPMRIAVDYFTVKAPEISINLLDTAISPYDQESVGSAINSSYDEIAPTIAPDGKTLYFARREPDWDSISVDTITETVRHDTLGRVTLDHVTRIDTSHHTVEGKYKIWYSELQPNGEWGTPKKIGKPLNNRYGDNLVITVTPDNNTLLLENLYNSDGSHRSQQGISMTHRRPGGGWTVPQPVNIRNYYNHNEYESFSLSTDHRVLIMSVERDDSYGDKDLYVSFRQSDGSYSEPKHMGPVLNSYASDGTPYLAPDNRTLYFYSYVEPGYGSADIFVSKRLDDSWTNWSTPKNLGPKINNNKWNVYYSVSAQGDYAYLVNDVQGTYDISRIKLKETEKPEPVVMVYGKVFNQKTKEPLGAEIRYEDLDSKEEVGLAESDPTTGDYKIVLPYGLLYGFRAEAKGFISVSERLDIKELQGDYVEVEKDLYLVPIEKGQVVNMKTVLFKRGKAIFLPESYPELERLAKLMKDNPSMEIELAGHTDNVGNKRLNQKLSEERVKAVEAYLVKQGIDEKRISGRGYGGSKPIAPNTSEETRRLNRRVEFEIVKE